jgi:hypothetical protein
MLSIGRMTNANVDVVFGRDSSSLIFEGKTIAKGSKANNLYTYLSISNRVDEEKKTADIEPLAPHISASVAETYGDEEIAVEMQKIAEPLITLSEIADIFPAKSFQREPELALKHHENRRDFTIGIRNTPIILIFVILHLAQLPYYALIGITDRLDWTSTRSQIAFARRDSTDRSARPRLVL